MAGSVTSLGLSGAPQGGTRALAFGISGSIRTTFTPMGLEQKNFILRPNINITELNSYGGPFAVTTISLATKFNSVAPSVSTFVRPVGAVITRARRIPLVGHILVPFVPSASALFHRSGSTLHIQGNIVVTDIPFGFIQHKFRRSIVGGTALSVSPRATVHYTAAPARSNAIVGHPFTSVTPHAGLSFHATGTPHAIAGSILLPFTINGHEQVHLETTHLAHGRVSISITAHAALQWTRGAPVTNGIAGSTAISIGVHGTTHLFLGIVHHNFFAGSCRGSITPKAKMEYSPAPVLNTGANAFIGTSKRRKLRRVFH